MATIQGKQVAARVQPLTPDCAGEVRAVTGDYVVTAAFVAGAIVEMGALPANCIPVDFVLASEDADSDGTPAITLDAGILSGDYTSTAVRTIGAEFLSGSTVAQGGGVVRQTLAAGLLVAPSDSDRGWGIKVGTAADVLTVGAKIRATLYITAKPSCVDNA